MSVVEDAERMGAFLLGTCSTEAGACEALDIDEGLFNDAVFCAKLDEKVLCCETCGWWHEPCDIEDNGNCGECNDEG